MIFIFQIFFENIYSQNLTLNKRLCLGEDYELIYSTRVRNSYTAAAINNKTVNYIHVDFFNDTIKFQADTLFNLKKVPTSITLFKDLIYCLHCENDNELIIYDNKKNVLNRIPLNYDYYHIVDIVDDKVYFSYEYQVSSNEKDAFYRIGYVSVANPNIRKDSQILELPLAFSNSIHHYTAPNLSFDGFYILNPIKREIYEVNHELEIIRKNTIDTSLIVPDSLVKLLMQVEGKERIMMLNLVRRKFPILESVILGNNETMLVSQSNNNNPNIKTVMQLDKNFNILNYTVNEYFTKVTKMYGGSSFLTDFSSTFAIPAIINNYRVNLINDAKYPEVPIKFSKAKKEAFRNFKERFGYSLLISK
jgi:hypothetical protein